MIVAFANKREHFDFDSRQYEESDEDDDDSHGFSL
jgi:hypothetical protein